MKNKRKGSIRLIFVGEKGIITLHASIATQNVEL